MKPFRELTYSLLATLLIGAMLLLGCPESPEERFKSHLTQSLALRYDKLSDRDKKATAYRALAEIAALKRASWEPLIVNIEKDGDVHRPVYNLGVGRAKLLDCRLSRNGTTRTGSCSAFSYPASWNKGAVAEQKAPLTLHLAGQPRAQSAGVVPLVLGVARYSLEGTVLIKADDALVQGGTLLVPDIMTGAPGAIRVPLREFSLLSSETTLTLGNLEFAEPFPLPPSLVPLLGTATSDSLAVHGNLGIDLQSPTQGYQVSGEISFLGKSLNGKADIYPGAYIAASLGGLSLPGPIEGMCIPIRNAAVELDMASQILRVTGTTEIESAASLLCDEGLSLTLSLSLAAGIGIVRSLYKLPEKFSADTQFVLDKNDEVLCANLAVQGKSLFRGAYLGASGPVIWAPISSSSSLSTLTGSPQLPPSNPGKCWEGDPGPKARGSHSE